MTGSLARAGLLAALFAPAGGALAAQSAISTLPDSVIAGRTGSGPILVVIRNSTAVAWTQVRFACLATGQVTCQLDGRIPDRVKAWSAISRRLTVSDALGTAAPGVMVLRLDYVAGDTVGIATAALKLSTGRFPKPESAAEIGLAGSLISLSEKDSALVYLSVRNLTDTTMTVLPPAIRVPRYLTANADSLRDSVTVPPGTAAMIPVIVESEERVHPGRATLLFVVPIRWRSGGRQLDGDVVLSKELEIQVAGASEIMKLLGLPSLLFLPGALVLLTCMGLWKLLPPRGKEERAFPFQTASGEFLVLSITISLAGAMVGRAWVGRDYLRYYGLTDVVRVWLISIGVGIALYVLAFTGWLLLERRAQRKARLMNLADRDDPVTALEKLARSSEKSLLLDVVYLEGAQDNELLMLGRDPDDAKLSFLASKIEVNIDEVSDEFSRLNELLSNDNVRGTAEYLRALHDGKKAIVAWGGDRVGVRRALAEKLKPVGSKERWILI